MYYANNLEIRFVSAYSNACRFIAFNYTQYKRFRAELEALKPVLAAVAWFVSETAVGAFECFCEQLEILAFYTESETIPEFTERKVSYADSIEIEVDEVQTVTEEIVLTSVYFISAITETFCQISEIQQQITKVSAMTWNDLRKFLKELGITGRTKTDLLTKYEEYLTA
jgi:hypothetical protein